MRTKWQYTGDVNPFDYGGKWFRRIGERLWQFIELTNMDDACGRDNEGRARYVVELSHVDLDELSAATLKSALSYVGVDSIDATEEAWVAEACHSYGAKAPLGSWEGNNAGKLLRSARSDALVLAQDESRLAEKMSRPVNALGSTAHEYMTGNIDAAVERGIEAGQTNALIVGKMMGKV